MPSYLRNLIVIFVFLFRSEKVVTYTDSRDFPMTSWSDVSDWPPLDTLAMQGFIIIGVTMEKQVEQGDRETKAAFDNFRNKFVQENCHRDVEIRSVEYLLIVIMMQRLLACYRKRVIIFLLILIQLTIGGSI